MSSAIIVGAGLMGRWHAHAAHACGSVVCAVDRDVEAASRLGRRFGAESTTDLATALQEWPRAVVHVCTPVGEHVRAVRDALVSGHHVVCEKPVAASLAMTRELIEDADRAGVTLTPALQFSFQPWASEVSRVGTLLSIDHAVASAGGEDLDDPARAELAWGIAWHSLSVVGRLLGEDALQRASWQSAAALPGELRAQAVSGSTSVSLSVSLAGRPPRNELTLVGTQGTLRADLFHGYGVVDTSGSSRADKALRPFRQATGSFVSAAANLGRRATSDEPAFPGLTALVRAAHAHADHKASAPLPHSHLITVATAAESLPRRNP